MKRGTNIQQEKSYRACRRHPHPVGLGFVKISAAAAVFIAGCTGTPTAGEQAARKQQQAVADVYRPQGHRRALPHLTGDSSLSEYLRYAMLNQPQVEAAYYDWTASVQRITVERSLPDPRLTFEADIADMVMAVMPGLMVDLPGPGKLRAVAEAATAESEARYFGFETAVLRAAFALKRAYYQLHFLEAKVRVNRENLRLVNGLERLARQQNEVGKVTLQDVLRAQIEQDRLSTEIANLEDSRQPLLAAFKAALGLQADAPAPPIPSKLETTPLDVPSDQLLAAALARNPRLKSMEAEVRRAEASLRLAYKVRVPDFNLGVEADVKASPVIFTPQFGMTLPLWRDKIAAEIAAAQAQKQAAEARLSAEQITLAVEFAERSFAYREATRSLQLLQEKLLPKARQSLEVAQSGYTGGKVDFLNVLDAERMLLGFQLAQVESQIQRELSLAELSLLILGVQPSGAPTLAPTGVTP